jgi:hypothetical protein
MPYHVCNAAGFIITDDTEYTIEVPCWACAEKCSRRRMEQQITYAPLTPELRADCISALRCVEAPRILAVTKLMRTYHILPHEMRLVLNEVEMGLPHREDDPWFDFQIKGNGRYAYWENGAWVIALSNGDPLYTIHLPRGASRQEVTLAACDHVWETDTREHEEFPWGEFDDGKHWQGEALRA